jgi:hypothetical protein
MRFMLAALVFPLAAGCSLFAAKDYNGPVPPKPDIPYLLHASKLVEPEVTTAMEKDEKKVSVATVAGAASPVRTPLPEPIFIYKSQNIQPQRLQMFKMQVKGDERRVEFANEGSKKSDSSRPVILMMNRLGPDLYRIEVNEPIDDGQYCISPSGAQTAFCFEIY